MLNFISVLVCNFICLLNLLLLNFICLLIFVCFVCLLNFISVLESRVLEKGSRYLVLPVARYLARGTRYGTRYLALDTWYQEPGTRYQVPGILKDPGFHALREFQRGSPFGDLSVLLWSACNTRW